MANKSSTHTADSAHDGHESSLVTYYVVFFLLICLTGLTIALAVTDLGVWHTPVGLIIATTKATLVVLFFMHLLHATRLTKLMMLGSLLFLAILFWLLLSDYLTRGWLNY